MSKRGQYASKGLSALRRRWNVLRAVRRYRKEPLGPSWETYVRATSSGRKEYRGKGVK